MPGPHDIDEFNPNNPYTAVALLGMRVDNLGKEKEALERDLAAERKARADLEKRVAKIEGSLGKGMGVLIGLSAVGTLAGVLLAYGKAIFRPWAGTP